MVEVTGMLVRKTCILFLFAALLGAGSLRAQQLSVEARIAGLESNEEYRMYHME